MTMLGNLFSWLITALFGVLFLLLVYESWAIITHHTPITDYVRPAVHEHPAWAFAISIVIGVLLAHFLWRPASGRTSTGGGQA